MELLIDRRPCDLPAAAIRLPGFDAAALADLSAAREGRRLQLELPATPRNDLLFGFARDPEAGERFNDTLHEAALSADGAELLRGTVRLLAATESGYTVEVRDGGAAWATQAAARLLHDLDIPYAAALTPQTIRESWTNDAPVKFFPIERDNYPAQSGGSDLLTAVQLVSVDDYHPFLHLATVVGRIFSAAGYTLRSDFFAGDFFRSLYMSGAYASHDTAAAEARMGFLARRLGEATATADARGRVEADPAALYHTVGNLVETATPSAVDADGEPLPACYDHGSCFTVEEGRILFRPTTRVEAGFEYGLRYTTDHRIRSRTRLTGFDTVYLDTGGEVHCPLPNRYIDRRDAIAPNHTYRAVVFDHAAGAEYRLLYTRDGVGDRDWCRFAARSALVTTPASGSVAAPRLQVLQGSVWQDYAGDWALYDGHIGETGETTVELRVRTAAETLAPDAPKYFDRICFSGAEEGQRLTLRKECSVRTRFGTGPGFGSPLAFADVARHDGLRQIEVLEALAHLFNLRFRSDEERRIVQVEPRDRFYGAAAEVDLRERTVPSEGYVLTDTATGVHELRSLGYRAGDGAVQRFERAEGTTFGMWRHAVEGFGTLAGEQVSRNPLFHPTRSAAGGRRSAPSALLLQIGDRDDLSAEADAVTPRIVRYFGLRPLPAGERWEEGCETAYPLAAFHLAGAAETLCFEDRDGAAGLHRRYDRQFYGEERLGRIELTLRCTPHEAENLLTPDTGTWDLGARFRLGTRFGETCGILRRVGPFDPGEGRLRCTFDRTDGTFGTD